MNGLSMKAEIEKVVIATDEKYVDFFQQTINDIKACCHAKTVEIALNRWFSAIYFFRAIQSFEKRWAYSLYNFIVYILQKS